ncbi:hypothetical protein HHL26_04800 [Sphingobium sp. TB-6]|uniref:hypothetical protein n=1 Tax=Sphingobium sp. TB-6 TaxID=2728850 RepID=UPI00146E8C48|nr:hypothetical protein [Sphingobium sp. TB-6]NML88384.1 hypothetical protein [Sphingobium sp. TB-6]
MRATLLLGMALLAGCADAGAQEEQKYRAIEQSAQSSVAKSDALCQQGKAVAHAYLAANNDAKFRHWQSMSQADCMSAALKNAMR